MKTQDLFMIEFGLAIRLHIDSYSLNFMDFAEVKFLDDELTKLIKKETN